MPVQARCPFRASDLGYLTLDINGCARGPSSEVSMGIGPSVFLIAVGAILLFAVHATVSGIAIHTVGVILMIAGAIGLVVTMTIFAPRRRARLADDNVSVIDPGGAARTVPTERVIERRDVY